MANGRCYRRWRSDGILVLLLYTSSVLRSASGSGPVCYSPPGEGECLKTQPSGSNCEAENSVSHSSSRRYLHAVCYSAMPAWEILNCFCSSPQHIYLSNFGRVVFISYFVPFRTRLVEEVQVSINDHIYVRVVSLMLGMLLSLLPNWSVRLGIWGSTTTHCVLLHSSFLFNLPSLYLLCTNLHALSWCVSIYLQMILQPYMIQVGLILSCELVKKTCWKLITVVCMQGRMQGNVPLLCQMQTLQQLMHWHGIWQSFCIQLEETKGLVSMFRGKATTIVSQRLTVTARHEI